MIRSILILLIPIYFSFFSSAKASYHCEDLFTERSSTSLDSSFQIDETDALITYLGTLLEHRIIGEVELTRFVDALEKGEIINPISEEQASTSSAALVHHNKIQEFIDITNLSYQKLLETTRKQLGEKSRTREKKEYAKKETENPYRKIVLHTVEPRGRFDMGYDHIAEELRTYSLEQVTEVMSTPVTQSQWAEMMGGNPSRFKKGEHTVTVSLNGNWIEMQPDHPVENMTWWSAIVYANRLSELNGFRPTYDLSDITWKQGTRAEDGTLQAESGELRINTTSKNHDPSDGDIYYQTEGYRLPTKAEHTYLLSAARTENGKRFSEIERSDTVQYAWRDDVSRRRTHPVALLDPLLIDGHQFYDLFGNIIIWCWDWYGARKENLSSKNPAGSVKGGLDQRITLDISFLSSSKTPEIFYHSSVPNLRRPLLGFYLVRTLGEISPPSPQAPSLESETSPKNRNTIKSLLNFIKKRFFE